MGKPFWKFIGLGLAAAMLAGCAAEEVAPAQDSRPRTKPEALNVAVLHSDAGAPTKRVLSRGRISTKSGDILILEPDGSVTEMALDTPGGRNAFEVSEADLAMLNQNLGLDLSGVRRMGAVRHRGPTAQEKAIADFKARTQPMKLNLPAEFQPDPKLFQGIAVTSHQSPRRKGDSLIEVTANLRGGVDADTAFAYATCALANWADAKGSRYARHIRTLRDERNGKMIVGSVFTLSDQKPMGLTVMTTKDTLQECKARGIPAA